MGIDRGAREDRWADWLIRGRQRGLQDRQVREMQRSLAHLSRRVLKAARLRPGQRVLDVGAGTGLLALAARKRVKDGFVVATDISHDALRHCRASASDDRGAARLIPIAGDAIALPFRDGTFDIVLTRSVLIYLSEKETGVRELYRVLKPGGRASIFEPINEVWRLNQEHLATSGLYDDFQPTYERIREHYRSSPASTFTMWDERDLLGWFERAGFTSVKLEYEHVSETPRPPRRVTPAARARLQASWQARPNPLDPSFEELVRTILGDDAAGFLDRFMEFLLRHPPPIAYGAAYLTAQR